MVPLFALRKDSSYAFRQYLKNGSSITTHNFEYYGDKMRELSPGIMHLLDNLAVERDKDISASLLQHEDKRVLCQDRMGISYHSQVSGGISGG